MRIWLLNSALGSISARTKIEEKFFKFKIICISPYAKFNLHGRHRTQLCVVYDWKFDRRLVLMGGGWYMAEKTLNFL